MPTIRCEVVSLVVNDFVNINKKVILIVARAPAGAAAVRQFLRATSNDHCKRDRRPRRKLAACRKLSQTTQASTSVL